MRPVPDKWGWCGGAPCEGDHGYGPNLEIYCMGTPWRMMRRRWPDLLSKWTRRRNP